MPKLPPEPSAEKSVKKLNLKTARPKVLVEATTVQLLAVSSLLEEVARNYVARLRRELTDLSQTIELQSDKGLTPDQVGQLRENLEVLMQVQMDPKKGRRKDLKKMDEMIGALQAVVEKW